jgi:hypothetical protein
VSAQSFIQTWVQRKPTGNAPKVSSKLQREIHHRHIRVGSKEGYDAAMVSLDVLTELGQIKAHGKLSAAAVARVFCKTE